ncbi:uncharacterized protein EV422DRAFT_22492 [Fimicolochytrium jonesii]|uniref:uncharacterized protein n=1 Tax=Fimicolochytrium jonesii TaxID=1396493 RepID=UPI0022FE9670|nr:uncharacterized protein EV422DRAFT_22492 [Fimicolochytrium jonesii]KAI8827022.1 hypothetical protein EV422DRAFT_22492 [Fimicolochytrium jonesii]
MKIFRKKETGDGYERGISPFHAWNESNDRAPPIGAATASPRQNRSVALRSAPTPTIPLRVREASTDQGDSGGVENGLSDKGCSERTRSRRLGAKTRSRSASTSSALQSPAATPPVAISQPRQRLPISSTLSQHPGNSREQYPTTIKPRPRRRKRRKQRPRKPRKLAFWRRLQQYFMACCFSLANLTKRKGRSTEERVRVKIHRDAAGRTIVRAKRMRSRSDDVFQAFNHLNDEEDPDHGDNDSDDVEESVGNGTYDSGDEDEEDYEEEVWEQWAPEPGGSGAYDPKRTSPQNPFATLTRSGDTGGKNRGNVNPRLFSAVSKSQPPYASPSTSSTFLPRDDTAGGENSYVAGGLVSSAQSITGEVDNVMQVFADTIQSLPKELNARYLFTELVGYGGNGFIAGALDRRDGSTRVAVKFLGKNRVPASNLVESPAYPFLVPVEAEILRTVAHPNIVRFIGLYADEAFFMIVMERIYSFLKAVDSIPEPAQTSRIVMSPSRRSQVSLPYVQTVTGSDASSAIQSPTDGKWRSPTESSLQHPHALHLKPPRGARSEIRLPDTLVPASSDPLRPTTSLSHTIPSIPSCGSQTHPITAPQTPCTPPHEVASSHSQGSSTLTANRTSPVTKLPPPSPLREDSSAAFFSTPVDLPEDGGLKSTETVFASSQKRMSNGSGPFASPPTLRGTPFPSVSQSSEQFPSRSSGVPSFSHPLSPGAPPDSPTREHAPFLSSAVFEPPLRASEYTQPALPHLARPRHGHPGDLDEFLYMYGILHPLIQRRLSFQLLSAYVALREKGIVYLDFRGENVIVDRAFNIKLVDFGMSQFIHEGPHLRSRDRPHRISLDASVTADHDQEGDPKKVLVNGPDAMAGGKYPPPPSRNASSYSVPRNVDGDRVRTDANPQRGGKFTVYGTRPFSAPEILLGNGYSGPEADIWALGILFFNIATGGLDPFPDLPSGEDGKGDARPAPSASAYSIKWPDPKPATPTTTYYVESSIPSPLHQISVAQKAIIERMLEPDPILRATTEDVLKCDWFVGLSGRVA